jgi:hypothetical protein
MKCEVDYSRHVTPCDLVETCHCFAKNLFFSIFRIDLAPFNRLLLASVSVHDVRVCKLLQKRQVIVMSKAFLGAFAKMRKATISFVMSLRLSIHPSAWNNLAFTGHIFTKFYI